MAEDDEPSILAYARFHGLTVDHRIDNPLSYISQQQSSIFYDNEHLLFQITAGIATYTPERLSAAKEAIALLSTIKGDGLRPPNFHDSLVPEVHRIQDLKVEDPLLRSDHALDMINFGGCISPDLRTEHLPLENVDDEKDEGLLWPSGCIELRSTANEKSESEKLSVSREVLLYINDVVRPCQLATVPPKFDDEVQVYKRSTIRDSVTPPLLPVSPVITPYVPSSDTGHLELLSDQATSGHEELCELEKNIMKGDIIHSRHTRHCTPGSDSTATLITSDNIGDIYSPLEDIKCQPKLPTYRRPRAEDLKVEGPLTPARYIPPAPWHGKKVSFQEALVEIIPELPPPISSPEDISQDDIDHFFAGIGPIAAEVERRIAQEQLQEADATQRVPIPIMDFSRPSAPWKSSSQVGGHSNHKEQLETMKDELLSNRFWPLSGKVERSLPWAPFSSSLAKVATREVMEETESDAELLSQPGCVDHHTMIWKLDGIRIFDDTDSDTEDIEYGYFPNITDMQSLLRKRKYNLEESELAPDGGPTNLQENKAVLKAAIQEQPVEMPFSAMDAIDDFICIRAGESKKRKLTESTYFPLCNKNPEPETPTKTPSSIAVVPKFSHRPHSPPPLPDPLISKDPRSFIISSSFLTNRPLFRLLQTLYPTADFIERDFALHATHHPAAPLGPPPRPSTASTLAHEADILLSPTAGLILTTLQKLAQRPLPGSKVLSPIYTRILLTAPRYTALYILVSDASASASGGIGSRAAVSPLIPFHAFVTSLPVSCTPSVILIPPPSPSTDPLLPLATYIVHLMTTSSCSPCPPLRQEETTWELFLRRAGLNAYAAQAVLVKLKPPVLDRRWERLDFKEEGGERGTDGGVGWGLGAFVRMGGGERVRRLESVVGREVLERVGRVLDARW